MYQSRTFSNASVRTPRMLGWRMMALGSILSVTPFWRSHSTFSAMVEGR